MVEGVTETTEQELAKILAAALEIVDLTVPEGFELEIAISQLVEHLTEYHKANTARKAARHAEDHQRAELLSKQVLFHKTAVALIQSKYPTAKAEADLALNRLARQTQANRHPGQEE